MTHRYELDTDRCVCGGVVVYFDRDTAEESGEGCEIAGVPWDHPEMAAERFREARRMIVGGESDPVEMAPERLRRLADDLRRISEAGSGLDARHRLEILDAAAILDALADGRMEVLR